MIGKNLGISEKAAGLSVKALNQAVASETVLYLKTRKAHWDIRGPEFYSLHLLWQEQYEILAQLVDDLAERVRMLGQWPVATTMEIVRTSMITEEAQPYYEARTAVEALTRDHAELAKALRDSVTKIEAAHNEDVGTVDLLRATVAKHEKMAWMLGALLEGGTTRAPEA